MKYNDESLCVKLKVMSFIFEIVVFCVIWMFVGPYFIDINTHSSMDIFDFNSAKLSWFLYGCSLYIGGKIIYILVRKIIKVTSKHK